jgi:phytoene dehydrogenase-like protein
LLRSSSQAPARALQAPLASGTFPGAGTPVPGLYACGDSCMPGIGVPAAAASGMIAANTLAPVWSHLKLLDALAL